MSVTKRCQHGKERKFSIPGTDNFTGRGYVYDTTNNPGTLGKQICKGGSYGGSTLRASPDTLQKTIDKWVRNRRRYYREFFGKCWNCGEPLD